MMLASAGAVLLLGSRYTDLTGMRAAREEAARERALRAQLSEAVDRLTAETRVAHVQVLSQTPTDTHRNVATRIEFVEIDANGNALPSKIFLVTDDVIFFDALVVKFEQSLVKNGDLLKGKSLILFRRIYGENQPAETGHLIDSEDDVPWAYRDRSGVSEFEEALWSDFWSYAKNPAKSREAGIRVAQGEAVYAPMNVGERWSLTVDASGGLNLIKIDDGDVAAQ